MCLDFGKDWHRLPLSDVQVRHTIVVFKNSNVRRWHVSHALRAFKHSSIVRVGTERVSGGLLFRVSDHCEKRERLFLAIDRPRCIEDLVTAMLGVNLCKHEQFHIGGVPPQWSNVALSAHEGIDQIVDFIRSKSQGVFRVGFSQAIMGRVPIRIGC